MPSKLVLLKHDDGQIYIARVLAQYRLDGRWRALVRYTTGPGLQYEHARWADDLESHPPADDSHVD